MTSSNSLSTTLESFLSRSSRTCGVTSKLRPVTSVAIQTPLEWDLENLLAIRGGWDVQLVAILGHGSAGNVNPLVIQYLHDFGIRQGFARIFGLDEALYLF